MTCMTSVKFTISLNGIQGPMFKGQRGLKQGDPLSPLLFVITMKYLSRLFHQASKQSGFEFHPHCKKLGLTHLQFVDDLLIFCKVKPSSLQTLIDALKIFTKCFGLNANLDKSHIVFGGN